VHAVDRPWKLWANRMRKTMPVLEVETADEELLGYFVIGEFASNYLAIIRIFQPTPSLFKTEIDKWLPDLIHLTVVMDVSTAKKFFCFKK
jgi:hypothetical protein